MIVRIHAIAAVACLGIFSLCVVSALEMRELGWAYLVIAGIGVLLCVLIAFFADLVGRGVVQSLDLVIAAQERLAANDPQFDLAEADRADEIGRLARSVLAVRDAGVERDRRGAEREARLAEAAAAAEASRENDQEETQRAAAAAEASRKKDQEELRRKAELDQKYVAEYEQFMGSITKALERLSAGDLTYRMGTGLAKEYEKIRAHFNGSVEKLQQAVLAVSANTSAIGARAQEITSAADDLSRRAEQQAASLADTAAAIEEVTATVSKTAEGASHAREVVSSTKSETEHGSSIMQRAIAAMGEIEKSSREIGQITGVIDDIAFQTNLLALNAGVEAARAGDAGRGFAVVASEVRALAQRSAEAAKKIKSLVAASEGQIGQGVSVVAEAGKALTRIFSQVVEIDTVVSDIATSAQEEAKGLEEVNSAIGEIDRVTQQNAAMVEESTSASYHLAKETEELTELISRFQVGRVEAASVAPVPAAASVTARAAPQSVTSGGGAVRKPAKGLNGASSVR